MLLTIILQAVAGAALGKVGAAIGASFAAFAAGYGIGKIGSSSMEAIARQPESAGNIRSSMIIVAGMIEGAALFAIIVCLLAIVVH
ncbi:MAG: ATP synthase F0 subunit C [Bacteroidales bacterium]|nr:ATP synthase F0 subunit C [Bacteroidales bacterium]